MDTADRHHRVRAFTKHLPSRAVAAAVTAALARLGYDERAPCWLTSEALDGHPAMDFDVSVHFQRKMFYFPRAYWRRLLGLPFGHYLQSELRPGAVLLDVGSNVGFYTLHAARIVGPAGRIVAFEPEPGTFESLRRSVERNGFSWVSPMNVALSDRDGELPFFTTRFGTAHSLREETPERADRYTGEVKVKVTRLDDLRARGDLELPRIDLVKMDVEGEEARAAAGMLETLRHFGKPPIWAEVRGPRGSTRAPNTYPAVKAVLEPLGYAPFTWIAGAPPRPVDDGEIVGREDVLFLARG